ncbi:MAG TPA: mechanosensitive ion channel domain-containing protein [Flavitalea sp.]|nr:mechanosensitive ion channel domain-containing protein [Flavitalea sp.]
MESFLDTIILDNTIRSYLIVTGSILLAVVLKRFLSRYIAGLLFRIVKRIAVGVDKTSFVNLVVSPLEIFLLLLVGLIAIEKLTFPTILDVRVYKTTTHAMFEIVAVVTFVISFIWLLLRIIDFIAMILHQKANATGDVKENQLIVFFKDFFKAVFIIIGALAIMKYAFGLQIGNLITGLSIATAAIALSLRESMENLIASFIIFFDKPFMMGDLVKVQGITGTVEKIGLRSTRIRTDQKTYVTVPNKQMVDSIMDNLSLRTQRRAFVQLELHSTTSHEQINQFVLAIENLFQFRKPEIENYTVFLSDINKNAFVIHVEFFTATIPAADFNTLRQQINLSIIQIMEDMDIRLATKEQDMIQNT